MIDLQWGPTKLSRWLAIKWHLTWLTYRESNISKTIYRIVLPGFMSSGENCWIQEKLIPSSIIYHKAVLISLCNYIIILQFKAFWPFNYISFYEKKINYLFGCSNIKVMLWYNANPLVTGVCWSISQTSQTIRYIMLDGWDAHCMQWNHTPLTKNIQATWRKQCSGVTWLMPNPMMHTFLLQVHFIL